MDSNFERHSFAPNSGNYQLPKEKPFESKRPNSGNNQRKLEIKSN